MMELIVRETNEEYFLVLFLLSSNLIQTKAQHDDDDNYILYRLQSE